MKLWKSLLAAVLVIIMICSLSVSAIAYNDVLETNSFIDAIRFVDSLNILPGLNNGDFRPEAYFSRSDAIIAAYRMLHGGDDGLDAYDNTELLFIKGKNAEGKDVGDIDDISQLIKYLNWAVDMQFITTEVEDAKFGPSEPINGAEFAALLSKILGLTDGNEVYSDDYEDYVSDLYTGCDITLESTTISRADASVALANTMMYDKSTGEVAAIGEYENFDGEPILCLANQVYGLSSVVLTIVATDKRPLGHEIIKGNTKLSNGVIVQTEEDFSNYIGQAVNVTYKDSDFSGTFTEGEVFVSLTVYSSTIVFEQKLTELSVADPHFITATHASNPYNIYTKTQLYLNDAPWQYIDLYDLVKLKGYVSTAAQILNRPNMTFRCIQTDGTKGLDVVFAYEKRPGRIIGFNAMYGVYTIRDYYALGSENEIKTYKNPIVSTSASVGDYINFYEANGECYIFEGSSVRGIFDMASIEDIGTAKIQEYMVEDYEKDLREHLFFKKNTVLPLVEGNDYVYILEETGEYMLTWENPMYNFEMFKVTAITKNNDTNQYIIKGKTLAGNADIEFIVKFDNVFSPSSIGVGDYLEYADNDDEDNLVTYVTKATEINVVAVVRDEGFYVSETDTLYYKSENFQEGNGSEEFVSGAVTLVLSSANAVIAIK